MVKTIFTWALSALPFALQFIPVLVVALVALIAARWILPLLPVAEQSRHALVHAANVVHSVTLRVLGGVFVFVFLAVDWMAFQSQYVFEQFQTEQRQ